MHDNEHPWEMYTPPAYRASDPKAIIAAFPFGQIVTTHYDIPYVTSVPMFLRSTHENDLEIVGHMARINPQAETLVSGQKALAAFQGPDAYVSASWYKERPTVPTWNYIAAQVRGILTPIDDDDEQLEIMRITIERSEANENKSWTLEDAPPGRVENLLPRIRSFKLSVTDIKGVTKLSQTHPKSDQIRVVQALENRASIQDIQIAKYMRDLFSS